ncbi:MAG: 30S ribosome-binding factor RbfA [Acidobacteriota bacterium]
MALRLEKVASLLRHELGSIVSRASADAGLGFTTVTEVRMTPDLRLAKVYVSIFGSDEVREKTLKHLESQKKEIRMQMASRVSMKYLPALQFYHDATLDRVQHLEELIKKIHKDDPPPKEDDEQGGGEEKDDSAKE